MEVNVYHYLKLMSAYILTLIKWFLWSEQDSSYSVTANCMNMYWQFSFVIMDYA